MNWSFYCIRNLHTSLLVTTYPSISDPVTFAIFPWKVKTSRQTKLCASCQYKQITRNYQTVRISVTKNKAFSICLASTKSLLKIKIRSCWIRISCCLNLGNRTFPTAMYCEYCYLSITFIAQLQESTGKTPSISQHLFEPPHYVMELTFSSRLGIQCMWKALQNLPKQIYFSSNSTESNLQSGELNKHMPFAAASLLNAKIPVIF